MAFKVYSKFTGKNSNGSNLNLKIEDFSKSRVDEAVEFFINNYVNEDPLHIATGVPKSKEALAENRELRKELLNRPSCHAVVCTLDDDSSDKSILGICVFEKLSKTALESELKESNTQIKTKEILKTVAIFGDLYGKSMAAVEKYTKDTYNDGRGVVVRRDLKNSGIVVEFLKLAKQFSKDEGTPYLAWLSTAESQIAGEQAGWATVSEVNVSELAARHGVTIGNHPPTIKYMVANA